MGSANESFVLRWNDFQANIANSFSSLREAEDFFDVTVAAVDSEQQLQAHKVILAASSGFFRSLLKRNPGQHPVLIMPPGVRFAELAYLVDFMYHGEVSILQDEIQSFMNLAELLKVKGLVEDEREAATVAAPQKMMPKMPPGINVRRRTGPTTPAAAAAVAVAAVAVGPAPAKRPKQQAEPAVPRKQPQSAAAQEFGAAGAGGGGGAAAEAIQGFQPPPEGDFGGQQGFQYQEQQMAEPAPGPSGAQPPCPMPNKTTKLVALQCPQCPSRLPGVQAFKEHMMNAHQKGNGATEEEDDGTGDAAAAAGGPQSQELQLEEQPVACDICDKLFKNNKNMRDHVRRVHKISAAGHPIDPITGQVMLPPGMETEPRTGKKRGRPKKNPVEGELPPLEQMDDGSGGVYDGGQHQKPIGQVQPAPRGHHQQHEDELDHVAPAGPPPPPPRGAPRGRGQALRPGSSPSASAAAGAPRGPQRPHKPYPGGPSGGRGRPLPPPPMPHAGGSGAAPDLKRIGMKYGGQISITSSDASSPSTSAPGPSTSRTVQNRPGPRKDGMGGFSKMRGDGGLPMGVPLPPPSAGPSGPRPSGPSGARPSSAAAAAADVMVKEEPEDEDEAAGPDEEYLADEEEEYLAEEFGPEHGEVTGSMYGEYEEGEMDQDDMDEEGEYHPDDHLGIDYQDGSGAKG